MPRGPVAPGPGNEAASATGSATAAPDAPSALRFYRLVPRSVCGSGVQVMQNGSQVCIATTPQASTLITTRNPPSGSGGGTLLTVMGLPFTGTELRVMVLLAIGAIGIGAVMRSHRASRRADT